MRLKAKIAVGLAVIICISTVAVSVAVAINSKKAGDVSMIGNDHEKAFATEYTELVPYGRDEDSLSWFDGMVTGNGENGAVVAGSPYSDSIIYNNINFLMPSNDPRYTPD